MAGHGHDNHGHGSDSDEIVLHQEKLGGVFVLSFLIAIVTLVVLGQAGNTKLTLLSGKEAYDSVQAQLPKLSSEHKKGDSEHKEEKKDEMKKVPMTVPKASAEHEGHQH